MSTTRSRTSGRIISTAVVIASVVAGLGLLGACDGGSTPESSQSSGTSDGGGAAPAEAPVGADGDAARLAAPAAADEAAGSVTTAVTVATQADATLIRTAAMQVRAEEVGDAVRDVEDLAAALQGTVTGAQVTTAPEDDPGQARASLTLRVPEERFREALRSLAGLGTVLDQREDSQDVTTEVVDVDARVKSQQASVERVRALLAKAATIGEVVSVEAELARREADLDALLSRQAALADQTARATITVELVGPEAVVAPPEEQRGFLYGLEQGWTAFVASGAVLLTMLGAVLPFAAVAFVVAAVTVASLRARARRSA